MRSDGCINGTHAVWYIRIIPPLCLPGKDFLLLRLSVKSFLSFFCTLKSHHIFDASQVAKCPLF